MAVAEKDARGEGADSAGRDSAGQDSAGRDSAGRDSAGRDWARPVVHWEIVAADAERQTAFYRDLFNWEIGDGPIGAISPGLGGPEPGPAGHIRSGRKPAVALYVQVRDLRASLDRAVSLGGTITTEPFNVPGGPTLAAITDPEGNPLFLVQQ